MSLEIFVYNFRKAIEAAKKNNERGELFRKFPLGQCGHTSDILAQYLLDNGISSVTYVNGTYYDYNDDSHAHTWLLVNGWVVDITGDQFKFFEEPLKYDTPIYIGPMIDYYHLFEINPRDMHEHFGLECYWSNYHELKSWYEIILQYLEDLG